MTKAWRKMISVKSRNEFKSLNLNQIKINVCISIEFRKMKKQIWNNWNKVYKNYSILVTIFALQSENDIISEIKCWFADLIQFFLSNLKKKRNGVIQ